MDYASMSRDERHTLIKHMLEEIENDLGARGKTNEFIDSLSRWFYTTGRLSEKQFNALRSFYDNAF